MGNLSEIEVRWDEFEMLEKGISQSDTARLQMPDSADPNIHGAKKMVQNQERPQNLAEQAQLCRDWWNMG